MYHTYHLHVIQSVAALAQAVFLEEGRMSEEAARRIQGYDDEDESKTVTFTFELRWPSGACIRRYENEADLDVERFLQHMDEGLIDGVPPAKTTIEGYWLEGYALLHGTVMIECGKKFSYYGIPHNAELTVVLLTLERPWILDAD